MKQSPKSDQAPRYTETCIHPKGGLPEGSSHAVRQGPARRANRLSREGGGGCKEGGINGLRFTVGRFDRQSMTAEGSFCRISHQVQCRDIQLPASLNVEDHGLNSTIVHVCYNGINSCASPIFLTPAYHQAKVITLVRSITFAFEVYLVAASFAGPWTRRLPSSLACLALR